MHYEEILKFKPKASIQFHAYDSWRPSKVKNLFIAEAPPWDEPKYFYNTDVKAGVLRKKLFDQLKIADCGKSGLEAFSKESFLIDTIKCRLKKQNSNPPAKVIANCAKRFLLKEVQSLKPERIVVLGKTAKQGLEQFSEFKALTRYRIKVDCGKRIQVKDLTVILYVFPTTRNVNSMRKHPLGKVLA